MIKIENEHQLKNFLKKITKKSYNNLFENEDPYVKHFKNKLSSELNTIKEQEGEDSEEEAEPESEEAEPESEEAEPESEEAEPESEEAEDSDAEEAEDSDAEESINFAAEKALELIDYDDDFDVSFENVMTALNTLRAGKSTKNKEIKSELSNYYDKLSDDERSLLLLYLNELSKVLTGATEGEDAQDPSDPSTYFNVIRKNNIKQSKNNPKDSDNASDTSNQIQQLPKQNKGLEDTTPPIRVNESQDTKSIYKKIKNLIKN